MEQKVHCTRCGSDDVEKNYNYNSGKTDFECQECGHHFTHRDITYCEDCGRQIIEEEFVFLNETLCKDCYNKKLESWQI
ncbi:MAG: IS1 family transposase [Bacilli bacterium]|nr:IS1 family transposase [Bacilli bacterium]